MNKPPSRGLKSRIYNYRQFWLFFGRQLLSLAIVDTAGPLTTAGTLGAASHPAAAALHSRAVSHHSSSSLPPTAPLGSGLVTQACLLRRAWLLVSTRLCPGEQMAYNVADSPAVCIQVTAPFCARLISSFCAGLRCAVAWHLLSCLQLLLVGPCPPSMPYSFNAIDVCFPVCTSSSLQ